MRKMDMLHGSIGDKTVSFAILLAVTGICQQLFNAIDIIIMGRFVGKEAMAAVGSNAPVVGLLVTFFVGISLGANVVISQYTGQGNLEKVKKAVHTTIVFAVLAGILFAVLGVFSADSVVRPFRCQRKSRQCPASTWKPYSSRCRASLSITSPRRFSGVRAIRGRRSCASLRPAHARHV